MDDFKTTFDGSLLHWLVFPYLFNSVVARDKYSFWTYVATGSFGFCRETVMVGPDLNVVT